MKRPSASAPGLRRALIFAALLVFAVAAVTAPASAQSLTDFEKKVTVHKLDNGWTFVIVRRPIAPVFTFATLANVGSAQEVNGITGLAHMFEHMAFKGTDTIGTTDYRAEKKALDEVETAYKAYDSERRKMNADPARIKGLKKLWQDAQDRAEKFVVKNQFDDIIDREGGVGLNAGTNTDMTIYFYSLPSNKVELWAYLESARFAHPVFRQFYKERDVVMEERRMRTESTPFGKLFEAFLNTAFTASSYKHTTVGYMSDLKSFSATDAKNFYKKYYVPSNLVTVVVGDVEPSTIIPLIDKYFGKIPKGNPPPPLRTVEPEQTGERIVKIEDPSQPIYAEGYHKPAMTDPDEAVYDAIQTILGGGRTSRLYRRLVRDDQVAAFVQAANDIPGGRYPDLFVVFAAPAKGHTNDDVEKDIRDELNKLTTTDVTDDELAMVKARAKADLVRGLASNQGLAFQLAVFQTRFGDWRELFKSVDRLDAVTKADILRVAKKTFKESNRTIAMIETTSSSGSQPAPAGE